MNCRQDAGVRKASMPVRPLRNYHNGKRKLRGGSPVLASDFAALVWLAQTLDPESELVPRQSYFTNKLALPV